MTADWCRESDDCRLAYRRQWLHIDVEQEVAALWWYLSYRLGLTRSSIPPLLSINLMALPLCFHSLSLSLSLSSPVCCNNLLSRFAGKQSAGRLILFKKIGQKPSPWKNKGKNFFHPSTLHPHLNQCKENVMYAEPKQTSHQRSELLHSDVNDTHRSVSLCKNRPTINMHTHVMCLKDMRQKREKSPGTVMKNR